MEKITSASIAKKICSLWEQMRIFNGYYEYRTLHGIIYKAISTWAAFDSSVENKIDNKYNILKDGIPDEKYDPMYEVPYALGRFNAVLNSLPKIGRAHV